MAVPFRHPAPNAELCLATDTSDFHMGGIMQQKLGDQWRPLGFFSKKLAEIESHYSTFDQELLAVYLSIQNFHHFCEGRPFQLWTDHDCHVSSHSPHFAMSTTPLGIHFQVKMGFTCLSCKMLSPIFCPSPLCHSGRPAVSRPPRF
jgi:hypothetical protein